MWGFHTFQYVSVRKIEAPYKSVLEGDKEGTQRTECYKEREKLRESVFSYLKRMQAFVVVSIS